MPCSYIPVTALGPDAYTLQALLSFEQESTRDAQSVIGRRKENGHRQSFVTRITLHASYTRTLELLYRGTASYLWMESDSHQQHEFIRILRIDRQEPTKPQLPTARHHHRLALTVRGPEHDLHVAGGRCWRLGRGQR